MKKDSSNISLITDPMFSANHDIPMVQPVKFAPVWTWCLAILGKSLAQATIDYMCVTSATSVLFRRLGSRVLNLLYFDCSSVPVSCNYPRVSKL